MVKNRNLSLCVDARSHECVSFSPRSLPARVRHSRCSALILDAMTPLFLESSLPGQGNGARLTFGHAFPFSLRFGPWFAHGGGVSRAWRHCFCSLFEWNARRVMLSQNQAKIITAGPMSQYQHNINEPLMHTKMRISSLFFVISPKKVITSYDSGPLY